MAPMLTSEDAAAQTSKVRYCCSKCRGLAADNLRQFLEIWSEDGVTAEPEDDMMMA